MNRNTLYIALLLIGGIFTYWLIKRPKANGKCAELWKNMNNKSAQTFYFEALNLAENSAAYRNQIAEITAKNKLSKEYNECMWSIKYAMTKGNVFNDSEAKSIELCMCESLR